MGLVESHSRQSLSVALWLVRCDINTVFANIDGIYRNTAGGWDEERPSSHISPDPTSPSTSPLSAFFAIHVFFSTCQMWFSSEALAVFLLAPCDFAPFGARLFIPYFITTFSPPLLLLSPLQLFLFVLNLPNGVFCYSKSVKPDSGHLILLSLFLYCFLLKHFPCISNFYSSINFWVFLLLVFSHFYHQMCVASKQIWLMLLWLLTQCACVSF